MYGDGGGKAPALKIPLHGADRTAKFLISLGRRGHADSLTLTMADVNGQPGALAQTPTGEVVAVFSLDIADNHITSVLSQVNPDKLAHLSGVESTP